MRWKWRILSFNDDGKIYLYYILKRRYPVIKNNSLVLFVERTGMNWKTSDVTGFCITILFNNMGWYLGVIGNLHNNEYLIYIFTYKVENGNYIIFNKTLYNS